MRNLGLETRYGVLPCQLGTLTNLLGQLDGTFSGTNTPKNGRFRNSKWLHSVPFSLIVSNWHHTGTLVLSQSKILPISQSITRSAEEPTFYPKNVEVCNCWMCIWAHTPSFFLNPPCSGPACQCWCDRGRIRWDPVRARQTPSSERIRSRLASQMIEVSLHLGECTTGVLNIRGDMRYMS